MVLAKGTLQKSEVENFAGAWFAENESESGSVRHDIARYRTLQIKATYTDEGEPATIKMTRQPAVGASVVLQVVTTESYEHYDFSEFVEKQRACTL